MIGPGIRAGVVLLSVAALGALGGIAFERHQSFHAPAGVSAVELHEAAMADLRDALGLDADQLAQIHEILLRRQDVVQQMWDQLRPELQEAMRAVHAEIAEVLRPDQLALYHDWLDSRRDSGPETITVIPRHR